MSRSGRFVKHAKPRGHRGSTPRHPSNTAEQTFDLFVSHVSQDHEVASAIAAGAKLRGLRAWCEERDQRDDTGRRDQRLKALARSRAIVVLVSLDSIRLDQVTAELTYAQHHGLPILSLLLSKEDDLRRELRRRDQREGFSFLVRTCQFQHIDPAAIDEGIEHLFVGLRRMGLIPRKRNESRSASQAVPGNGGPVKFEPVKLKAVKLEPLKLKLAKFKPAKLKPLRLELAKLKPAKLKRAKPELTLAKFRPPELKIPKLKLAEPQLLKLNRLATYEQASYSESVSSALHARSEQTVVETVVVPPTSPKPALPDSLGAAAVVPKGLTVGGPSDGPERPHRADEVPVDRVHFSVAAAPVVRPAEAFIVSLYAHSQAQRDAVMRMVREAAAGAEVRVQTKGPVRVTHGTVLTAVLRFGDLIVDEPEDTILWDGEIGSATFPVRVPEGAAQGARSGRVMIFANGVQTIRVDFTVVVGAARAQAQALSGRQSCHRTAFASYASEDEEQVAGRIQAIQKFVPDVFWDRHSLRSGEKWEEVLWAEIERRDVFYLFWSQAASRSAWVEKEWRHALQVRGIDYIDPMPLVSPREVPPPLELAKLHFNDWMLAYIRESRYQETSR
jgi:hypothetical protein